MRPRVFPAEDFDTRACLHFHREGFNEAAGIPRGRRFQIRLRMHGRRASMRPRVFPAEDRCEASMAIWSTLLLQ